MTEKRFINDIDNGQLIDTKGELSTIDYSDTVDFYELWEFLNKLADENEQLKKEIEKIAYANEDLLKEKRQWEKLSDEYAKLYEENEQLKKENQKLIEYGKELLNYINSPPKHRKSIFDAVICFKDKKR